LPDASKLLIVAESPAARDRLVVSLSAPGVEIRGASDTESALEALQRNIPDVIVADAGNVRINGKKLVDFAAAREEPIPVVLIAPPGAQNLEYELPTGAYDYLPDSFSPEQLRTIVRHAVERQTLLRENRGYYQDMTGILAKLKLSQTAHAQAEKIGSLGRLVAGIAHEVNTPLGVLQSGVDTIERAAEKIREWHSQPAADGLDSILEIIDTTVAQSKAACDRIDALVTTLRQFAQLDRADFQRANIHEGIESALGVLDCPDGIEITKEYGDLPEIDCSPRQLNQLFLNLLLNAVEAIRQAGGRGQIRVKTWREGDWVKVSVSDSGIGIPQENLQQIFDPGFTTKGVQVGTGLGLPVCFQIARAHQGRIEAETEPGKGSCFTVSLPANHYL
jgi:signal transduction histidine kinase